MSNLIPDLILLDIMCFRETMVIRFWEKIRQMPEVRDVPVIMVTAKGVRNLIK